MPIRYICRKCGAILYEYIGVSEQYPCGTLSPHTVARIYNYVCPVCGSRLKSNTRNPDWREHIIIKPASKPKRKKHRSSREHNIDASEEIKGVRFITSTEFIIEEL
jgi:tRNA(Ile2) C34 agmatinyltransferase TiaS